jgi:hypothetical protein
MAVRHKKMYTFAIDFDLAKGLKFVKARDGVPESEQVRRGVAMWLRSKGVKLKPKK